MSDMDPLIIRENLQEPVATLEAVRQAAISLCECISSLQEEVSFLREEIEIVSEMGDITTCWVAVEKETGRIIPNTHGETPMESLRAARGGTWEDIWESTVGLTIKRAVTILWDDAEAAAGLAAEMGARREGKDA